MEYWVSLAENSGLVTQEFSAYFFDKRLFGKKDSTKKGRIYPNTKSRAGESLDLVEMEAITKLYYRQGFIEDKENWTKISYEFIADGKERFLVLGDFEPTGKLDWTKKIPHKLKFHYHDAYYFIDDISLKEVKDSITTDISSKIITTHEIKNELQTKREIILPHVIFEHNKAELNRLAKQELDSVVLVLASKPDWEIEIQGHTDNQGDSLKNITLSNLRSLTVANYLISNKIQRKRITSRGFGSQFPLMSNLSSEGRRRNRRVVIKLNKKK